MNTSNQILHDFFSARKGYRQRGGTQNSGRLYESGMATLIALRATLDENILDMWVAANGEGLGAFDDLILYTEHKLQGKKVHVVQLKHKLNYTIVKSSFTNKNESFYLNKYKDDYNKIRNGLLNGDIELLDFFDNLTIDNFNFVLYTNSEFKKDTTTFPITERNVTLNLVPHRDILNTGENGGCVYKFRGQGDDVDFYDKLYFYIKQSRAEHLEGLIYSEIKERFGEMDIAISRNIMSFFDIWAAGELNGNFKLTKQDVKIKLLELLISPYIVEPCFVKEFDETGVWRKIVNEVDVIIVEETTTIITGYVYFALKKIVETFCGDAIQIDLDNWVAPLATDVIEQLGKKSDIVSSFYGIFGKNTKFTWKLLHMALWRIGVIPLVVNVTNKQLNVIMKRLRLNDYKLRLIVLGNRFTKMKYLTPYKTFTSLSDIPTHIAIDVTSNVNISLQGRVNITLRELIETNEAILKSIDSTVLLKILTEETIVGSKNGEAPEFYVNRYLTKPTLKINVLKLVRGHVFIVTGCTSSIDLLKKYQTLSIIEFDNLGNLKPGAESVVICEPTLPRRDYDEILRSNKLPAIHHLHYYASLPQCLEWKRSWGNASALFKFVTETPDAPEFKIYDTDTVDYTDRKVRVISAHPGMGKSAFMANIANHSPIAMWILMINLNNFTVDLKKDFDDPLDYFYEKIEVTRNKLTDAVFNAFKSKKRIVVLMDGFDEISPIYKDQTTKIIKWFESNEYATWVTSRPVMQTHLESTLNTLSFALQQFFIEDVNEFLSKYLRESIDGRNYNAIGDKVRNLEIFKNNTEFLGNPLHLKMAADYVKRNDSNERGIDIVDLYENFVDRKLESHWEKSKWDGTNSISMSVTEEFNRTLKKRHEELSLTLFFDADDLNGITKPKKVDEFLKNVQECKKNIGIIVGVSENHEPIFGHRTYAEYLTGTWLARNVKKDKIKKLLPKLYHADFVFIREVFDRILARGAELHTAILNQNVDYVRECSNTLDKDLGGRTALHLAASWGPRHYYSTLDIPFNTQYIKAEQHYVDQKHNNYDKIVEILLQKGLSPDDLDDLMKWNAFNYASRTSCLSLIELLYGRGYDYDLSDQLMPIESLAYFCSVYNYLHIAKKLPDFPNVQLHENKDNLIHVISENGHAALLQFIFENYAHFRGIVNNYNAYKEVALHRAVLKGHNNCIDVLANNGAIIDRCGVLGKNSVILAVQNGHAEIVKCLFKNGADINQSDNLGNTALHLAAEDGHAEIVEYLLTKGADINRINEDGQTAMQRAAEFGSVKTFECLWKEGVNINLSDTWEYATLPLAAKCGHAKIVKDLVTQGADINQSDARESTALHLAAERGHAGIVEYLLTNGADINQRDELGSTALHLAAEDGHAEIVEYLWKNGADINQIDADGQTAMQRAANFGSVNTFEYLWKKGANINLSDAWEYATLPLAAKCGHAEIVDCLVNKGADINQSDAQGSTALHLAARCGRAEIVDYLVTKGADINQIDADGQTAMQRAADFGSLKMFECLWKNGANINLGDAWEYATLPLAAKCGHAEIVDCLLKKGADINQSDAQGSTALHLAARRGHAEIVKCLLKNGADINQSDELGSTALHLATKYWHAEIVECLLMNGADINQIDADGQTAMQRAADVGSLKMFECLWKKGANINLSDAWEYATLPLAAKCGHPEIVKYLLTQGADINQSDAQGSTALHLAAKRGRAETVELLLTNGADINQSNEQGTTALHLAAKHWYREIVDCLLKNGADINQSDAQGHTTLHFAASWCNTGIVDCLLENGADINQSDSLGCTALHFAVNYLNTGIVKRLLTNGADINQSDAQGCTVLHLAAEGADEDIIRCLLTNGADINQSDAQGRTALHFAAESADEDIIRCLLTNGANINQSDAQGRTALHLAADTTDADIIRCLLTNGADSNQSDAQGRTALHLAAERGHAEIVECLLTNGADINPNDV